MKRRVILGLVAAVLLITIAYPYIRRHTGGDVIYPSPWWQSGLGVLDALLLALCGIYAWRERWRLALHLLIGEVVLNLSATALYLTRDGLIRFSAGFAGLGYLAPYVIAFVARAAVVLLLVRGKRAPAPPAGASAAP